MSFIYHTTIFKERFESLKCNIDFRGGGGVGWGYKGEEIEMSTMQKRCHFKEVSQHFFRYSV